MRELLVGYVLPAIIMFEKDDRVYVAWSESISDQAIWVYIGRVSRGVDVSIEVGQPPS